MPPERTRRPRAHALAAVVIAAALALWLVVRSRRRPVSAPPAPVAVAHRPRTRASHAGEPGALALSTATSSADPGAANGALEGRVVSSADGRGVPRAAVTFEHRGATSSAIADAEGRFSFVPSEPGRYEVVSVTGDGFFPFEPALGHSPVVFVAEAGQRVRDVVLTLLAAAEYTGVVHDIDGAPVAGATVKIVGEVLGDGDPPSVSVVSGADGRFAFRAGEQARLDASKPGYAPAVAMLDFASRLNRYVVVRMARLEPGDEEPGDDDADTSGAPDAAPEGSIAGTVLAADGAPREGTPVVARSEGEGAAASAGSAVSGPDGRFVVRGLEPGAYTVRARGDGFTEARAEHVAVDTADLVLRLPGGARLVGSVRDASSGQPVAGFAVRVERIEGPLARRPGAPLRVFDARGRYEVSPLAPGSYAVTVLASGYAPSDAQTVTVPDPASGELTADFALARGGRARGTVTDAQTHAPVAGARVELESSVGDGDTALPVASATTTDAQGAFVLDGLAPGPHSVLVSARGYNGRILSGVEAPPRGGDAPVLTIELTPTAPGQDPHIELAGIGAMLAMRGDALVVTGVMPGGGASAAGLVPGDAIVSVDGAPVTSLGFEGSVEHIRGVEGTTVRLGVRRGDAGASEVEVVRTRVQA